MGTGIEDVVAVKALETGCVPPVANFKEVDPELGQLNLSKGGSYPVEYAIHLGAGFGSQIIMMLLHWVKTKDGIRQSPNALGYAYRIADETAWSAWLTGIAGHPAANLEVVQRTLRVRDQAPTARAAKVVPASRPAQAPTPTVPAPSPAPPVLAAKPEPKPVLTNVTEPKVQVQVAAVASPVPPKGAAKGDPVKEKVLALVAEKTGYPVDMLDLDLDLEADLGVDTVKQAEVFASIREAYSIPRDENRKLRDYPTLAHVIRFVYEKRPDLAPTASSSPAIAVSTTPEPATVAAPAVTDDSIKDKVLQIVAEKTGYPKDMLDLDLDLEADLGIDTVKQAEMFAAIRAAYNIPRDENVKLRDFPTLAHVIKFAQNGSGASASVPPAAQKKYEPTAEKPSSSPASAPIKAARPALASLDAANRVPRRVPVPVLRPELSMCKPTGVSLEGGRQVVVMADKGGVAKALVQRLETAGVKVLCIENAPDAEALANRLKEFLAAGPAHGVFWLRPLANDGNLRDLDLATWHEAVRVRIKSLYGTMRAFYEQIAQPGTFLVSATRLGGQHGYDEAGAIAPLGGAVAGFSKALSASGRTFSSK